MTSLEGCDEYKPHLYNLSCEPQSHNFYSHCEVNNVKFVTWERDNNLKTQNSGVMVETDDEKYYGILEDVIELIYPYGLSVVVFKCRWFNESRVNIKKDHSLESLDTSITWFEDTPYCLALAARQVFYIDDPKCGGNWKVINIVDQRGMYKDSSLATDSAYQEEAPIHIPEISIESALLGSRPQAPPVSYMLNDLEGFDDNNVDDDDDQVDEDDDDEDNIDDDDDEVY